jgi:hypothetical protein
MAQLERRLRAGDVDLVELTAEAILELPDRAALSLIDPALTTSAMGYAGAVQNAPITQGTTAGSGLVSQGTTDATTAAQTASSSPTATRAENINSPNSLVSASQYQYAPSATSP